MRTKKIKQATKSLIGGYLNYHKNKERNIFQFSFGRSGSTWLMEIIYSNKGVKYSDQPPDWHLKDERIVRMRAEKPPIVCPSKRDLNLLRKYIVDLLNDKIQQNPPWNILNGDYNFITNRYILKITQMLSLIKWFDVNFEGKIVYLIRHPIAVAQSFRDKKWNTNNIIESYLKSERFTDQWLGKERLKFSAEVYRKGTYFNRIVLSWALANFIPLKYIQKEKADDWLVISYEELVLSSGPILTLLSEELNLSEVGKMKEKIVKPSKNADNTSINEIKYYDDRYLIEKWKNFVNKEEVDACFEILHKLGIHVYSDDCVLPERKILNFPNLI